ATIHVKSLLVENEGWHMEELPSSEQSSSATSELERMRGYRIQKPAVHKIIVAEAGTYVVENGAPTKMTERQPRMAAVDRGFKWWTFF
ncbi:hypothetical protein CYMTET_14227, partial [Cymbomonas tetramitiformis]